ncbi:hypothetical protein M0R45_012398 [Rubus argutus]|uniref:Uncharacterized protein n=1 Tax=Rubus argutus TaxID=59490 RepID=A0AAW1YFN0_RUBAR
MAIRKPNRLTQTAVLKQILKRAPAWEKSSNTMTNRDTLWMFQRDILWFMLEKTEPEEAFQSLTSMLSA